MFPLVITYKDYCLSTSAVGISPQHTSQLKTSTSPKISLTNGCILFILFYIRNYITYFSFKHITYKIESGNEVNRCNILTFCLQKHY